MVLDILLNVEIGYDVAVQITGRKFVSNKPVRQGLLNHSTQRLAAPGAKRLVGPETCVLVFFSAKFLNRTDDRGRRDGTIMLYL